MLACRAKSVVFSCCLAALPLQVSSSALLGAYIEHDGWSVSDIQKFNNDSQKPLGAVTLFTNFDYDWDHLHTQSSNIVAEGSMPVITWMPHSQSQEDMLGSIIRGEQDAYIASWIAGFQYWQSTYDANKQPRIFLRFGHEFNGNWYSWANQPDQFKLAWQYIHNLFTQAGVNSQIDWVWTMNNFDVDDINDVTRYYPGDAYVDWTSIDGYNWGSNYSFSSWASFDEVFSSAYTKLATNYPDKPIMIAEVGSAEPSDLPDPNWGQDGNNDDLVESKEAWVDDMYTRIESSYPGVMAVAWFNTNKELSWSLNGTAKSGGSNTGLNAYNQRVSSAHYVSSYADLVSSIVDGSNEELDSGTNDSTTTEKGNKKRRTSKRVQSTVETTLSTTQIQAQTSLNSGLSIALEKSKMPEVVGQRLLQRMSKGFKNLSPKALENIRRSRLQLNYEEVASTPTRSRRMRQH